MQAQQQGRVAPDEQLAHAVVLQQADGHFRLAGLQRMLDGSRPVFAGGEPLAGAQVPAASTAAVTGAHLPGQGREQAEPAGRLGYAFDEAAEGFQLTQQAGALPRAEQVFAKVGIEARQVHQACQASPSSWPRPANSSCSR